MKKILSATVIGIVSIIPAAVSFAATGTINFTGSIIDSACTLKGVGTAINVPMGKLSSADFTAAGDTSAAQKFTIVMTNCPAAVTATVNFDGKPDASDPALLGLSGAGTAAKGVAIQLMSSDKTLLPLNTTSIPYSLNATGDNELVFFARYKSTEKTITAGDANATANFSVVYN
ncbi:TPA: type 1 fimbrial protein [Morganella morganii]|nr:type 1 fimbrial protein [Morganella morganii subsp. morganii]HDU8493956.1 type 1 fimbrial protein [Morganella morganii]